MAKGYKQVSEKDFVYIKQLTDAGLTNKVIHHLVSRSATTINTVRKTATYEEFRKVSRDYNNAVRAARVAKYPHLKDKIGVPVALASVAFEELNELPVSDLARIANALERLADAWEASPKKKWGL